MTQSEPLAARLGSLLATFPPSTRPARARHIIQIADEGPFSAYRDCVKLSIETDFDDTLANVIGGLNRAVIESLDPFAVHSGVVRSGERLIALPAQSGNGKTTLTAALLQRGFEYLSDEALVLRDATTVLPYPKPLALSPWSRETLGLGAAEVETLFTPEELGTSVGDGGALTDVVLASYGAAHPEMTQAPGSEGMAALIRLSFNHYKNPEKAFRTASQVASSVRVWRLSYTTPQEGAELLATAVG